MLVFQDMESTSTVGSITKGLETWLPKWRIDDYTGASFEWAMNEPFIRRTNCELYNYNWSIHQLVHQSDVLFAAIALQGKIPTWVLPTHVGFCIALQFHSSYTEWKKPQISNVEQVNSVMTDTRRTDSEGNSIR
jgi:hypothetical protein